ncbi:Serine/threonine-protein kinase tousled-like 2 [Orchesella cincta]|uniref:non-specific serine/threonine protein kinase n=1 Tax=Orchesella cincta TaxID=48709 RepID=A0A1D2N500_ORCCI|nr:Serine/threonine-protein kinase tousled-like 2 [Orchesella cincta]
MVPGPERKRKRKADDGSGGAATSGPSIGSGSGAGGSTKSTKKINDYFSSKIAGGSPNRHQQHGGAKSPSPHPSVKPIFPASPQNVSSSTTVIDRGAAHSSVGNVTRLAGPSEPLPVVSSSSITVVQVTEQQEGPCLVAGGTTTSSVNSVVAVVNSIHKAVQTELTGVRLAENEAQATADVEMRDSRIDELNRSSEDLRQQLTNHQRLIEQQKAHINKCIDVVKKLLIEKSTIERKEARQRCMQNRLKLGQFVTQRVGATFQENWTDGYAFQELTRRQEEISNEKEDIDRQRKLLGKRRPTMTEGQGRKGRGVVNGTSDGFAKPEALRQNALKKEDADLQLEMEKLERERNLHIRELKRILTVDSGKPITHVAGEGTTLFFSGSQAFDLKEQRYVACKVHQLNKDWKDDKKANYIKHALREYNIHKQLDHPRVVKLYDVFEIDANSFCTVLEYCDGHDLDFYLKQHKTIPEREARSVIMQVVSALKYLNEIKPPIIHYDLKPGNILLTEGNVCGEIKITDFGLSKVMDEDNYNPEHGMDLTSQGAGTYWYLPPECFVVGKTPPKISSKVDVWSVGVIFYQCLYGKKPFGHNQSQATILEENTILKATEVQFPNKPTVSPEAKQLIRQCLAYRKEDRLDVMQLARSEYLQPPIPRYARQNAAAAAAAAASHVGSTSSSQSLSQQPTTPTGNALSTVILIPSSVTWNFTSITKNGTI